MATTSDATKKTKTETGYKPPLGTTYAILEGDTLESLAARFQSSVNELKSWNNLGDTEIETGMLLRVAPVLSAEGHQESQMSIMNDDSVTDEPDGLTTTGETEAFEDLDIEDSVDIGEIEIPDGYHEEALKQAEKFGIEFDQEEEN